MANALVTRPQNGSTGTALAARIAPDDWSREYLDVLKATYGKGTTDAEFALAVQASKSTGLRIDTRELWIVKRNNEPMQLQISIDGFRAIAHTSGDYAGEEGPLYCGKDGQWREVWTEQGPPVAAKFTVWRKSIPRPFVSIVPHAEFAKLGGFLWAKAPLHMLGIRAATHAFRKSFRQEIAARQLQAEDIGAHVAAEPAALPYVQEDADSAEVCEPDEATPAATTSATPAVRDRDYYLKHWNLLVDRAIKVGVDHEEYLPDFALEKATIEQLLEAGKKLRAVVEVAEAAAQAAPAAPEVETDADDDAPAAQPQAEAPGEDEPTDVEWQQAPTVEQLRAQCDALSAEALSLSVGHKAPAPDATAKDLADWMAALQPKVEAAKAAQAKKGRK